MNAFKIGANSFLLLRKDRIFWPLIVGGAILIIAAKTVSSWSISDFEKTLMNTGLFFTHLTGTMVAIFWGTRTITEALNDGSVETQLASPISRTEWVIGKTLGLWMVLFTIGVVFVGFWQLLFYLTDWGWLKPKHLYAMAFQLLHWMVMGAMAVFLASLSQGALALFASVSLWVAGMASSFIAVAITTHAGPIEQALVTGIAMVWDLNRFNLVELAATWNSQVDASALMLNLAYGLGLLLFFLFCSSLRVKKMDLGGR